MARYLVTEGPILHDDKRAESGDEVELSKAAAEPLLSLGVIAPKARQQAASQPQE
jgi:hypothetical protein